MADTVIYQTECISAKELYNMQEGINRATTAKGYKYLTFSFDILSIKIENKNVANKINTIIPIISVGPANKGKI